MAQAPATSKTRRALMRLAAPAGLAPSLAPRPSEAAALAARARPLTRPEAPEVVFLLPLVGRRHVIDWESVSARLAQTIQSFRRQSSPRWRAVICGQDTPEDLPDDPRVTFLPFTGLGEGNDKWGKLATLARALPGLGVQQGYAMPFDADDMLAPHVVEEMTGRRVPGGYLVTHGYVLDAATGHWAMARPQSPAHPRQKAFWKLCGSCAAFGVDLRETAADAALLAAITAHEHRMFPHLAALAGRPLRPLAGPAALYIVNHGGNFGARRGRTAFKTRFVSRFRLSAAETARARGRMAVD